MQKVTIQISGFGRFMLSPKKIRSEPNTAGISRKWHVRGLSGENETDMARSWPQDALPTLTESNSRITSPSANRYNCLAWAAGEDTRWWWPDPFEIGYWPPGIKRSETKEAFVRAYRTLGFHHCDDGALEPGNEKIALFGKGPHGSERPTHAACQLESGEWTSKLGTFEDIVHSRVEDVAGPEYGRAVCYLSRPRGPQTA